MRNAGLASARQDILVVRDLVLVGDRQTNSFPTAAAATCSTSQVLVGGPVNLWIFTRIVLIYVGN